MSIEQDGERAGNIGSDAPQESPQNPPQSVPEVFPPDWLARLYGALLGACQTTSRAGNSETSGGTSPFFGKPDYQRRLEGRQAPEA